MAVFLILFVYFGLIARLTSNIKEDRTKRLRQALLGGIGLWIIMALRSWTCGQDLLYAEKGVGYIVQFVNMEYMPFLNALYSDNAYEPGFNLLFWFIYNYISPNPQLMLAITSGIEIGLIGYTLYKQSPNIILSYIAFACLGLYIFSFSGLRQGLGFALTFFAFNFIDDKKGWKFFGIVLLAFTVHKSSLLFLPAYFFRDISLTKQRAILGVFTVFAFLPVLMPVIQYFSLLIYGKEKYSSYQGGAYGLFALFIAMLFFSFKYIPINSASDRKMMQMRWMCLIAIFLQSSGILSAGALARIAYNYSIFFCLLLPFTTSTSTYSKKINLNTIIAILLVAFFVYCNKDGFLNVVPYRFFWEEHFDI